MTKKQKLTLEIFSKTKDLMSKYDSSFIKKSDEWIMQQIEQRLVSGGSKGYAFKIHCYFKEYTFYTCCGIDKLAEYISLISVSKNTVNLLSKFEFNNSVI